MSEDVVKLPLLGWEFPRPRKWDFMALAVLLASVLLAGANLKAALGQPPGASVSSLLTALLALLQTGLASLSLFVLGKTAKEGTLWGNLLAVAGMLAGVSGVLLATALWAAA